MTFVSDEKYFVHAESTAIRFDVALMKIEKKMSTNLIEIEWEMNRNWKKTRWNFEDFKMKVR